MNDMFLTDIIAERKLQLAREKALVPADEMITRAINSTRKIISFKNALSKKGLSVIAEVKKASPSKGLIQPDFDPCRIAKEYEKAGAAAISCLTEEHYFQGSSGYLQDIRRCINLPVLRKDFIIDEYQIYEARAIGADAVLLIAAILEDNELISYNRLAHSLGLDVLAEAHNEEEVTRLVNAGFDIIGINNRNLKTFEVTLETTGRLSALIPDKTLVVCESGIKNNADMHYAKECNADAVLVGETLMRSGAEGICDCMKSLRAGL